MQTRPIFRHVAFLICSLCCAFSSALAQGLYSQLVFTFANERPFAYRYDKSEHALIIELKNTSPNELNSLDHYDERLIRRVLIKDLGPVGTEVKLVLRDRDVRAHITEFHEPYRIAVDIFDAHYEEQRDPQTGLPMVGTESRQAPYQMVAESGSSEFIAHSDEQVARGSNVLEKPDASRQRKLLQPAPQAFVSAGELADAIRDAAVGIGPAWKDFPPYIYRIQTAAFEGESSANTWNNASASQAMTSAQAMASYASQLYSLGHENRALVAYQQVLHNDASIFERDALHLWKFAEIHLGQGNLTLARGYYEALSAKHPSSSLARFAQMRILDLAAIRLIQRGEYDKTSVLAPEIAKVRPDHNGELAAQIAIRKAYWAPGSHGKSFEPEVLPVVSRDIYDELASSYGTAESRKTKFYASNLILNKMLVDVPWTKATGEFAANYMDSYQGDSVEPYRSQLRTKLIDTINKNLQTKVANGELVQAVRDFESLPRALTNVERNTQTAWSLAEAYRKLGRNGDAVNHYATAAEGSGAGPGKFKAQFWLAVTAANVASDMTAAKKSDAQVSRLEATSRKADRDMMASWEALADSERDQINTTYKGDFEDTVVGEAKLRSPPTIVLQNWTRALSTKVSVQSGGDAEGTDRHFSPSGSAVMLLSRLAKRFAELGQSKERRESLQLLRLMKPSDLADDQAAKKLWAGELIELAEDYRKNSQYLDAGRLFSLVGKEAENWEGRAEALYKGGLLLYRAGRKQEAMTALQDAANDGNNIYYANLARERLAQIK